MQGCCTRKRCRLKCRRRWQFYVKLFNEFSLRVGGLAFTRDQLADTAEMFSLVETRPLRLRIVRRVASKRSSDEKPSHFSNAAFSNNFRHSCCTSYRGKLPAGRKRDHLTSRSNCAKLDFSIDDSCGGEGRLSLLQNGARKGCEQVRFVLREVLMEFEWQRVNLVLCKMKFPVYKLDWNKRKKLRLIRC